MSIWNMVSTELNLKFQPKFQKQVTFPSLLGRKGTLFSSHTMYFDIKFQPLKMRSDYCHQELFDLKMSNKLDFPI